MYRVVLVLLATLSMASISLAQAATEPANPKTEALLTDKAIDARIAENRTGQMALTLTDGGKPVANAKIVLRQKSHTFLFGCNAFGLRPDEASQVQQDYQKRFADLLNCAVLPFYLKSYEPEEGKPQRDRLEAMSAWCVDHGLTIKGHTLVWQNSCPSWLDAMDETKVLPTFLSRIDREVKGFPEITLWDVVNEPGAMILNSTGKNPVAHLYKEIGAVDLIRQCFAKAKDAGGATLSLNDYKVGPEYAGLISKCLKAGAKMDVIGVQSHMHTGMSKPETIWETCERLGHLGLPVHFTEVTIPSAPAPDDWKAEHKKVDDWLTTPEGEKTQAADVVRFYKLLLSHPSVRAIIWWDFSDRGAWEGCPAGLVRKDMSPKPAYEALHDLIKKQWWIDSMELTTDAAGKVSFRGWYGRYEIVVNGKTLPFTLEKSRTAATLAVK
jgi:GH35 family endo-1,4-beta-xylanase